MKHFFLLSLLTLLVLIPDLGFSQDKDSWDDLVISEIRYTGNKYGNSAWGYIEFTNMGQDTLDLSKYWAQTSQGKLNNVGIEGSHQKATLGKPGQTLLPGKTFTFVVAQQNDVLDRYGKRLYPNDYVNYMAAELADSIIYPRLNLPGNVWMRERVFALYTRADTNAIPDGLADSAMVDKFWYNDFELSSPDVNYPIAGIITPNPLYNFTWVRKFAYKHGETNFDISRGTNAEDAQWQALPRNIGPNDVLFTTVGKHMVQENLDITPKAGTNVTVNMQTMTIVTPYDLAKDSLFRKFNYGPNHAWLYMQGPDTASYYVSDGDSVQFYVVGNELKTFQFALKPQAKPSNFVKVAPTLYKNTNGVYTKRYTVSNGIAPIDTIGQVPFSTPTDTLLKYLTKDETASFEFIWKDGIERPEVIDGDILHVTSGNNSKDYKITVWPYAANSNSELNTVIFPGLYMWENPNTYAMTDTMVNFLSGGLVYVLNLSSDVEVCPQILVTPASSTANVTISRAKNLSGSEEDRTITVQVVAEDDSTTSIYKFILNVERETPPIEGEVFFTDIAGNWGGNGATAIQLFNPSDKFVNINEYAIIVYRTADYVNWIENTIGNSTDGKKLNSQIVRPGSYVTYDNEGTVFFATDFFVSNLELGPQGMFTATGAASYPTGSGNATDAERDKVDMLIGSYAMDHGHLRNTRAYWWTRAGEQYPYANADPDDTSDDWLPLNNISFPRHINGATYALYKITNDSIINGTKTIYKNFWDDFKLVDVVNGLTVTGTPWKMHAVIDGMDSMYTITASNGSIYRLSDVYHGNTDDLGSFGDSTKRGEWFPYEGGTGAGRSIGEARLKNHTMITAAHISYLSSNVYLVSKGLSQAESIVGVLPNTTVNTFMQNIILADPGMKVSVKSSSGLEKAGDDQLVQGDKVTSTAANELTSVTYVVSVGALSSNTTLITKNNAEFSISGTSIVDVPFGMTVKDFVSKIEGPATAVTLLTDGGEYIIPFETYAKDTLITERVDARMMDTYKVEVSAQDGITKTKYSISFKDDSKLFVISDVYTVNEEENYINFVSGINVKNFLANLIPSPGASIMVVNKMNQVRELGMLQFHDKVMVKKGNNTRIYYIRMMAEKDAIADKANTVKTFETSVYPNPSNGNFTISGLSNANTLSIVNIAGQTIKTLKVKGNSMPLHLDTNAGIYFINVMNNNKVIETRKIVIE